MHGLLGRTVLPGQRTVTDEPIGWRMSAVANPTKLSGVKAGAWCEDFGTKEAAIARKLTLQSRGFIATVTPRFVGEKTRSRLRQLAPFGDFNAQWTLK